MSDINVIVQRHIPPREGPGATGMTGATGMAGAGA